MPDNPSMDKKEAARVFKQVAVFLQLAGENPFKARAYENGARIIESYSGDMAALVTAAREGRIKGVGKAIADKLTVLTTTGELPYLKELEARLPAELPDLLKVPGLGPKKVKRLYDELAIRSLGELEYACHENRLAALEGFGPKSQQNILDGIRHIKTFAGRFHYHTAREAAEGLCKRLEATGLVDRLTVCGSLRRGKETIKDIDLLAVSEQPVTLMAAFTGFTGVQRITAKGETKSAVVLDNGLSADLRVVPAESYPAALNYFTGSARHNTVLRQVAKAKGFKLNEYGLFKQGTPVALETEADIYRWLGMRYVPPPLREDMEEIEAAQKDHLPDLVSLSQIQGLIHAHTRYSDGTAGVAEMARACRERGYHYLVLSDHSQSAVYAGGVGIEALGEQKKEIDAWNAENDFRIFSGIESDILADGSLDYPEPVLAGLDCVIASVHSGFSGTRAEMTRRTIRAVENPHTRILGHPTGRLLLGRKGYEIDMEKVVDACRANHTAIELNANPFRLDIDWRLIHQVIQKGVKIAIGPDAHSPAQMDFMAVGVAMARKGWCESGDILNCLDRKQFDAFCKNR